jgi:hypothetical protein
MEEQKVVVGSVPERKRQRKKDRKSTNATSEAMKYL